MQVVNKLVAKKKLLAKNESLPSKFYDEALEKLLKRGCGIEKEALKKRVNRAFAKESASLLTPIPPAVASDSSKKRGGRPRGTSRAEQDDAAKRYKECLNSITTAYANEKKISELTLKPMPISFLQDLIRKKKSEFNVAADIPHKTIFSRVLRNKSDPDKHKLNSMHPGTSSPLAAVEKTIVDIIIGMAQIRQPMTKTEVIKMMNDAIKGTPLQEEFAKFKNKRVASGEGDDEELHGTKESSSVEELFPYLNSGPLKGLRISLLHGRLKSEEKERVMNSFSRGETDVLLSTTVIEVGVDVPNATMMVIMDADRFGVSQLHQLRGRIGRGSEESLCLFVTKSEPESPAMKRLQAVASTTDGFELSRLDLEERREGDVLGRAQSGVRSHLRLLRVLRDEELILRAREIATEIIDADPNLAANSGLRAEVDKLRDEERAQFLEKK